MTNYLITGGNEVNYIEALTAKTMIGAKRQQTILLKSYDRADIWIEEKGVWLQLDGDGSTTGDMRDMGNFMK